MMDAFFRYCNFVLPASFGDVLFVGEVGNNLSVHAEEPYS